MKISECMMKQTGRWLVLFLALPFAAAVTLAQQPAASSSTQTPVTQEPAAQPGNAQNSGQSQNSPAKPMGTAVAPYEKTMGVTASRPAGAVIAPGKQRRIRAILIKVGVIVGAGVAIGTVAALSHGSSSQPH